MMTVSFVHILKVETDMVSVIQFLKGKARQGALQRLFFPPQIIISHNQPIIFHVSKNCQKSKLLLSTLKQDEYNTPLPSPVASE